MRTQIDSAIPEGHVGIELMRGRRVIESGIRGKFDRFKSSAKYAFSFSTTRKPGEKK